MLRSIIFATALFFAVASAAPAQSDPPTPNLNAVLDATQAQSKAYREAFRNLLADELKRFEEFDKTGVLKRSSTVKSSLLVYQSGKNATSTSELRNVLAVDGTPIPDSQKRGEEFLAELDKQQTLESELKKIQSQSAKYDRTLIVYGITLNQAIILEPAIRPAFDFELVDAESNADVVVIRYVQRVSSPNITVNEKRRVKPGEPSANFDIDMPRGMKRGDIFMRGKLFIDAKTFRIRREERELAGRRAAPVVLISSILDYQTSDFGVFVPKSIAITLFRVKREKDDVYTTTRDVAVNFDYSNFRQTNVEVRILDDETN